MSTGEKAESVGEIILSWRRNIEQAEADADELGIDCVYTSDEVRSLLDRIGKADRRGACMRFGPGRCEPDAREMADRNAKLTSLLSTAVKSASPGCVECSDVCDMCPNVHASWIPLAKLMIAGGDYDPEDYDELPIARMARNASEVERLRAETERLRDELAAESRRSAEELARKTAEIQRLRKALKPILECRVSAAFSPERQASNCMGAVADALHALHNNP